MENKTQNKTQELRNQLKTIRLLETLGYKTLRIKDSDLIDVIGISKSDVLCVQVWTSQSPTKIKVEAFRALPVPPNCRKLLHVWANNRHHPQVTEI